MNKFLLILLLLIIFFSHKSLALTGYSSFSAVSAANIEKPSPEKKKQRIKPAKLNFFERIYYKMVLKKMVKEWGKSADDPAAADRQAKQAHLFGWLGLGLFLLFPIVSIPFGIIAITKGEAALKNGTVLRSKARTGLILGIVTLSLIIILLMAIFVIIAGFSFA